MNEFKELEQIAEDYYLLNDTAELLSWDQEVIMPKAGVKARTRQKSVIDKLSHDIITDEKVGQAIQKVQEKNLDKNQQAILREIKRTHQRSRQVPGDLRKRISEQQTKTVEKWREAKEKEDFSIVQDELEEMVELQRKRAKNINENEEPYKVLFRDYEPYLEFEKMLSILEELETGVKEILEKIDSSKQENVFKSDIKEEKLKNTSLEVLNILGFEDKRMRLDESSHPFTSGNQFDARITTSLEDKDPLFTMTSSIHEMGHAMYQLNLPQNKYGDPLGSSRELSIHESQSRLIENHVGRSKGFSKILFDIAKSHDLVKAGSDSEKLYRKLNEIEEDNMIRTEADELTYHLHIKLRMELERDLINGDLEVKELEEAWDQKMEEKIGLKPEDPSKGVLQDIHWFWGNFGYFPTYSLGSTIAAQLFEKAKEDIEDLDPDNITESDIEKLQKWLSDRIHSKGQLYETEELIYNAIGTEVSSKPFLNYAEKKFTELYL